MASSAAEAKARAKVEAAHAASTPPHRMRKLLRDMGVCEASEATVDMLLEFEHRVTSRLIDEAHANAEYACRRPRHHITDEDVAVARQNLPKPKARPEAHQILPIIEKINAKPITFSKEYNDPTKPIASRLPPSISLLKSRNNNVNKRKADAMDTAE